MPPVLALLSCPVPPLGLPATGGIPQSTLLPASTRSREKDGRDTGAGVTAAQEGVLVDLTASLELLLQRNCCACSIAAPGLSLPTRGNRRARGRTAQTAEAAALAPRAVTGSRHREKSDSGQHHPAPPSRQGQPTAAPTRPAPLPQAGSLSTALLLHEGSWQGEPLPAPWGSWSPTTPPRAAWPRSRRWARPRRCACSGSTCPGTPR